MRLSQFAAQGIRAMQHSNFENLNSHQMRKDRVRDRGEIAALCVVTLLGSIAVAVLISVDPIAILAAM
jgi:hypothetical protein